ncbi:hypothetical protein [Enterobacter hormaechei]|uniref:hypothetical protein n=1 Tax=Enterobacter hormaechei TaxID=158836 RepID=UPI002FF19FD1
MKYQLAKLYRGDLFFGYGIAVGGFLLEGQVSTVLETEANAMPKVIATFNLGNEHSENQPRINLDNPLAPNAIHLVIHPSGPLTVEQVEELRSAVKDFLAKRNLADGDVWKS